MKFHSLALALLVAAGPLSAAPPNILVIMTDDVGMFNVALYSHGMMGVPTTQIDRIGREGALFTDHYAHPSCTPGRAAFITGQLPIRTGLTTVGMAGSPVGLDPRDPTLAEVLKPLGYRCGQFGKNHLGDRNEHLPTVHGFDEFFGNLYHLNTEEEPELGDWPKDPEFDKRYRPRGVLEELKVADNTIVVFTADNGPMVAWFPDAGTTPFRGEKATTWEGGPRVPLLIRWPARIKAGKISNGIQTNEDLFTTLAAAAGVDDVAEQLKKSHKVHIDGVNNLDHWTGDAPSKRNVVYYYNEMDLTAIRIGNWKSHMQAREGFFDYNRPSALLFNLRMDPFELHDGHFAQSTAMKLGIA